MPIVNKYLMQNYTPSTKYKQGDIVVYSDYEGLHTGIVFRLRCPDEAAWKAYLAENGNPDESVGFWGEVYDESWNSMAMEEYKRKRGALLEKYGSWYKSPVNERPVYPSCSYENITASVPYGYKSVLAWVNKRFGTSYEELYLERYFLNRDDTISEC